MPLLLQHVSEHIGLHVYYGHRTAQPRRVRAFVDLVVERLLDSPRYVGERSRSCARRRPCLGARASHEPVKRPQASRQELVERDRVVAHAHAGGVVDRVGDRRATPQMPSSPTPLAFIGDDIGSVSSRKITSWCGMSACTGTS